MASRSHQCPHDCEIRLTLPARAENVALVRHVCSALAEALAMPERVTEDMRLAVTEACTNVVRHAYGEEDGPIDVQIESDGDRLTVVVCDKGRGISPSADSEGPGLGLPLIAALTDGLEIEHAPDQGSRLAMSFSAHQHHAGVVEAA
jgi:anti-sigma regulatory factor (Ser/Thr protein kinase)